MDCKSFNQGNSFHIPMYRTYVDWDQLLLRTPPPNIHAVPRLLINLVTCRVSPSRLAAPHKKCYEFAGFEFASFGWCHHSWMLRSVALCQRLLFLRFDSLDGRKVCESGCIRTLVLERFSARPLRWPSKIVWG